MTPDLTGSGRQRNRRATSIICTLILLGWLGPAWNFPATPIDSPAEQEDSSAGISQKASDSCAKKVKALETHAAKPEPRKKQTTRFSQEEINSYLALELKGKYHPSLRSLEVFFEENMLKGTSSIDFDKLSMSSTKMLARLVARLLSGIHTLSVQGKLVTDAGKANFVLDEARFDTSVLPNFLVEEIISAVGRKQKPPFDPIQPSRMPYEINRVEVHRGYIIVFQ